MDNNIKRWDDMTEEEKAEHREQDREQAANVLIKHNQVPVIGRDGLISYASVSSFCFPIPPHMRKSLLTPSELAFSVLRHVPEGTPNSWDEMDDEMKARGYEPMPKPNINT